jgi:hypothetical protein
MRNIDEYNWTTNRPVYNKARKLHLDHQGKIRCSYCGYNRGENDTRRFYHLPKEDGYLHEIKAGNWNYDTTRKPNWKLVSKNRKQWMKKRFILKTGPFAIEITW